MRQLTVFLALLYYGVLVRTSSSSSLGGDATIHALDRYEWILEKSDVVGMQRLPKPESRICRNYCHVEFENVIPVGNAGIKRAHALLKQQEEEGIRLKKMPNKSYGTYDMGYFTYKYKRDEGEEVNECRIPDNTLRIPRYIKSSSSTHRLVRINVLEIRSSGAAIPRDGCSVNTHLLHLSYEDVPSQCRESPFFKQSQAEIVAGREIELCGLHTGGTEELVDSDGSANIVKLAVATALTEWLGEGAYAEIGRGSYSTSHRGMVHAFVLLAPDSVSVVKKFMSSFIRNRGEFTKVDTVLPSHHNGISTSQPSSIISFMEPRIVPFIGYCEVIREASSAYKAIIANHRKKSEDTSSDRVGTEMFLLPIPNGVATVGTLSNVYCVRSFARYEEVMITYHSNETHYRARTKIGSMRLRFKGLNTDSERLRFMRLNAGFDDVMLDLNIENARVEERRAAANRARAEGAKGAREEEGAIEAEIGSAG